MLIDKDGRPIQSAGEANSAEAERSARAKALMESFRTFITEKEMTHDDLADLLLNSFSLWATLADLETLLTVGPGLINTFGQLAQGSLNAKRAEAKIAASLVVNASSTTRQ